MAYQRGKRLYEGKASELYEATNERGQVVSDFLIINRKDDITKLDGEVRGSIAGKGACTNRISNCLFQMLEVNGVSTHFVEQLSDRETLILCTTALKMEVIVRNIATGSLCKRLPFEDGTRLDKPLVEFDYKDDAYHDPLINDDHALALHLVEDAEELVQIRDTALKVNDLLSGFFADVGITLVDFKLEFGRLPDGEIIVIDEISPDTCRFWDAKTGAKLDKDIFRQGMGNTATASAYSEVLQRLFGD